jgi:hypothetical protein
VCCSEILLPTHHLSFSEPFDDPGLSTVGGLPICACCVAESDGFAIARPDAAIADATSSASMGACCPCCRVPEPRAGVLTRHGRHRATVWEWRHGRGFVGGGPTTAFAVTSCSPLRSPPVHSPSPQLRRSPLTAAALFSPCAPPASHGILSPPTTKGGGQRTTAVAKNNAWTNDGWMTDARTTATAAAHDDGHSRQR